MALPDLVLRSASKYLRKMWLAMATRQCSGTYTNTDASPPEATHNFRWPRLGKRPLRCGSVTLRIDRSRNNGREDQHHLSAASSTGPAQGDAATSPLTGKAPADDLANVAPQRLASVGRKLDKNPTAVVRIGFANHQSALLENFEPSKSRRLRHAGRNA